MDKQYVSVSNKRSVIHGISPNPKKDFTKLRGQLSKDAAMFETELLKNGGHKVSSNNSSQCSSLDDSFDFSGFDLIENYVKEETEKEKLESGGPEIFLANLKPLDLVVKNIIRR